MQSVASIHLLHSIEVRWIDDDDDKYMQLVTLRGDIYKDAKMRSSVQQ